MEKTIKNRKIPLEILSFKAILIMKLSVFIFCISSFSLLASNSYSQNTKISLDKSDVTIQEVLKEIENSSEFFFIYNNELINVENKVDIYVKDQKISTVLDQLFANQDVEVLVIDRKIVLYPKAMASQPDRRTVSGTVTDESGAPIVGVSVFIKGTTTGTITDLDGNFSLVIPSSAKSLIFSFVGMKSQEVEISDRNVYNVSLEQDVIGFEEVVAIGYGSARRKDLTSSITTITSEEMNKGVIRDPVLALQGKVPGLNITKDGSPYGGSSIILRGVSSLVLSGSPFFIVDGMPNAIMPAIDDIVSIDVLKDASATAIYGSRAANGVIIITTKRGEAGKQLISYNSYVAVETVSNRIDMMSGEEYRKYLSDNGKALAPEDDKGVNTDWQDELTRTGISHKNNLAISGGNNNTTYISSLEYYKNEGIIMGTSYDRINMRGSIEQYGFNNKLKLQFQVGGILDNSDRLIDLETVLRNMLIFQPTYSVYNDDGSFAERVSNAPFNPVALIEQHEYQTNGKTLFGNIRADLNIMEGLDYTFNASYNNGQSNSAIYHSKFSRIDQGSNGYASRTTYVNQSKMMETYLSYRKRIQSHNFNLLAGYSWQEDVSNDGFGASNVNFVTDDVLYNNLGLGSGFAGYPVEYGSLSVETIRMISGYARLNYDLMDKYLIQATIRRDGSSAFGRNVRWGTFPSVSVGWRLMEESFIKNLNVFDNLKLRAGYGTSGNSAGFSPLSSIVRWGTISSTSYFYNKGAWVRGMSPIQNENPDLAWERTNMLNVGLDFAVMKGKVRGTVEYYNKTTEGMIWSYPVPAEQYFVNSMLANVGEMENKGWEFSLEVTPVRTSDLSWNASFIASFNKNMIVSLSNDIYQRDSLDQHGVGQHGQSGNYSHRIQVGYPIGQFCLWEYRGENANGESLYTNYHKTAGDDGELTTTPAQLDRRNTTENAQPKATLGWSNLITYKNFTLDFLLRGVLGNYILNTTRADLNYPAEALRYNLSREAINEPINNTTSNYTSTRYLEKGDYIRLDNITLSYTPKLVSPFLKKLTVYTTVNNAFVLTNYTGIDPEIHMGGTSPGIDDRNFYPKTRSFIFGVNVDF